MIIKTAAAISVARNNYKNATVTTTTTSLCLSLSLSLTHTQRHIHTHTHRGTYTHKDQREWTEVSDSHKLQIPGLIITAEGSKPEILFRIAQTTAALTRLKPVWIDKSISFSSKIQLMRSLVTSIFLYACESWPLTAELQRRIQAIEMRFYRNILHISYKDRVTNEKVRAKIQ